MADVFTALVGQERAAAALRQYARAPVHAYLVTGPPGGDLHGTLVAFAAALQCAQHGCGHCEQCRLVLAGHDPDVYVAPRAGVAWRVDELREADRVSRRRPLSRGHQIVIIEDVDAAVAGASPAAAALLKSLEEPPARTIFLLSAHVTAPELDTLESRCVRVTLRAPSDAELTATLVGEGASPEVAALAVGAADGDLRRARVLVGDPGLAARLERWRAVPDHLGGTSASASALADELLRALDAASEPRAAAREEIAREAREAGSSRGAPSRKEIDARVRREQRRFRVDELRLGCATLSRAYRDRLVEALSSGADAGPRDQRRAQAALRALDVVAQAGRRLEGNLDETLLVHDLLLSLVDV
jgi:DNA polymerase-3 subunit delta'